MNYYAKRFFGKQGIVTDGLKLWLDASNPVSYPGSGTTWYDLSGNGNNGTMVGGVVPLNNAMQFDGTNDSIGLQSLIYAKTLSTWINLNQVTTIQYFFGYSNMGIRYNGSTFLVFNGSGTLYILNYTKTDSMINFTAVEKETIGMWDIYINGAYLGVSGTSSKVSLSINNIGRRVDGYFFKGTMNDIAIYDRSLTSDEVLYNFNSTKSKYGL